MEPTRKTLNDQKNVLEGDDKFDNLSDEEKQEIAKRFDEYIKKELKDFAENYKNSKYQSHK